MRHQCRYYPFSVAVMVHRTCGTAQSTKLHHTDEHPSSGACADSPCVATASLAPVSGNLLLQPSSRCVVRAMQCVYLCYERGYIAVRLSSGSSCVECKAGTFAAAFAQACTNFTAGTYSGSAASTCTNCSASTFSSGVNAIKDQRECLEALRARLTSSTRAGCLHIVAGDFNASLFPAERYGYTDTRYRRTLEAADNRLSDFIHHSELRHKWWNAGIRSGLLSWLGGCGTKVHGLMKSSY